jgi:crotonobetainyl-CoA:carnitine CoA-transferase CaiB-like acyl-CoA transferase
MKACAGLKLLDLSHGVAGPLAARVLADCGADVTRIVRPNRAETLEPPWEMPWQFGKAVRPLDLALPAGQNALRRLAVEADVLIESFRPGRMEGWGLGYEILADNNPRLVYCAISGYGPDGSRAREPGYEGLVQAYAGVMGCQSGFRPGPVPIAVPLASVEAGLLGAAGILAALIARERGLGRGQRVDTSLLAGALAMHTCQYVESDGLAPRDQPQHPLGATPGYKLYECADGQWIHVGALQADFFQKLLVAMDQVELLLDPRFDQAPNRFQRDEDREALIALLAPRFRSRPAPEWLRILEEADVPYAPVRSAEGLWQDPQAAHQRVIVEDSHPIAGAARRVGPIFLAQPAAPPVAPATMPPLGDGAPPLSGLRVVDVSAYIAGPFGGRVLADLGAEVIKVEPLTGEAFRFTGNVFLALNHGKRGVAMDLKADEGRALVRRLTATADAFLHNLRPGVAERLGLGYADLAPENPSLVYTHVSAFGPSGPYAHRPGYDPLGQALAGIERAQGGGGNPPSFLRPAVCDISVATTAAVATLAGLLGRLRQGRGGLYETSLLRAGAMLTAERSLWYAERPPLRELDAGQHGTQPLYRLYQTADGWLFLAVPRARWPALCSLLGLAADDEPDAATLERAFVSRSTAAWLNALGRAGLPAAPVPLDFIETFAADPQAQSQGLAATAVHPIYGDFRFIGPAVRLSETPTRPNPTAPALGEHTEAVLAELGLDAAARADLRARGVVGWGNPWPAEP